MPTAILVRADEVIEQGGAVLTDGPKTCRNVDSCGAANTPAVSRFPRSLNRDRLTRNKRGGSPMRRRDFIAGLGGAAAWPLAARAQPAERMRRIGVLMAIDENDPQAKAMVSGFTRALADLGWTDG